MNILLLKCSSLLSFSYILRKFEKKDAIITEASLRTYFNSHLKSVFGQVGVSTIDLELINFDMENYRGIFRVNERLGLHLN